MANKKQLVNKEERERESKSIIIWALYDDAESSYKKAIKKYFNNHNIEVYSIGINDVKFTEKAKYFYRKIDLSLNNFNLFKDLNKLPKPDIILASPPCESWSGADCDGKMIRKISSNGTWRVQNERFYEDYNQKCHPVKRRYFLNKERGRIIGESTIGATISIIRHYEPKAWIIENPKTSKMWEFQENHWDFNKYKDKPVYKNSTYYSSYDSNFSLKPTIFKSNVKLNLKKDRNINSNKNHMALGNYSKRSTIPAELIMNIVNQLFKKIGVNVHE